MVLVFAMQLPFAEASLANDGPSFDYLYILANEGGSSGGHTAIRFGPDVYHFQSEEGLLVLRRDRAEEFLYAYALLGNRTIQIHRLFPCGFLLRRPSASIALDQKRPWVHTRERNWSLVYLR